ncbi:holo-[acyl-carrier-protein] synthase [Mesobacillus persicus]|uniref:Holo-[acyl-carrier-protein] synthase n=1 Tax=Mesobacillus persicus TaxID=930146 RepID=A0A1H8KC89_9BACI|nr:holo-ACP synthase [Mesobacillus persicus]SEN90544.1 holo-[acyl-carrier-protein] synthase [Mesobacillus persicus]
MITGIGLDIVEISRITSLLENQGRFPDRVLTIKERAIFESLPIKRKAEFLAGRFAAKEAFSKAIGTGIGKDLSFLDIEIIADERGKPYVLKPFAEGVHLSITHSRDYAAAQVVIEKI